MTDELCTKKPRESLRSLEVAIAAFRTLLRPAWSRNLAKITSDTSLTDVIVILTTYLGSEICFQPFQVLKTARGHASNHVGSRNLWNFPETIRPTVEADSWPPTRLDLSRQRYEH